MYENQGVFKWLHDIMLFYTSRYKKEGVYCLAPKTGLEDSAMRNILYYGTKPLFWQRHWI